MGKEIKGLNVKKFTQTLNWGGWATQAVYSAGILTPVLSSFETTLAKSSAPFVHDVLGGVVNGINGVVDALSKQPNSAALPVGYLAYAAYLEKRKSEGLGKHDGVVGFLAGDVANLVLDLSAFSTATLAFAGEVGKLTSSETSVAINVPLVLASLHIMGNIGVLRWNEMRKSKGFIGKIARLGAVGVMGLSLLSVPGVQEQLRIGNLVENVTSGFNQVLSQADLSKLQSIGSAQTVNQAKAEVQQVVGGNSQKNEVVQQAAVDQINNAGGIAARAVSVFSGVADSGRAKGEVTVLVTNVVDAPKNVKPTVKPTLVPEATATPEGTENPEVTPEPMETSTPEATAEFQPVPTEQSTATVPENLDCVKTHDLYQGEIDEILRLRKLGETDQVYQGRDLYPVAFDELAIMDTLDRVISRNDVQMATEVGDAAKAIFSLTLPN